MDCIFCRIITGELPANIIAETPDFIAFRDINPVAPVHILIVPKKHFESIGDLARNGGDTLVELFKLSEELAEMDGISSNGYRLLTNKGKDSGQEVTHLHFHLVGGRKLGKIG